VNHKQMPGFTLIEMMISLTLLSFITMIGYQSLMYSVKQWQRGSDILEFQYDYYQAASWIRNKVGSSENVKMSNGNAYLFSGKLSSVEFVARYDRTRQGGLYVNKIFFNQSDNTVYVSYYLHHPDIKFKTNNDVSAQTALLSNVNSIRFSYYGKKIGQINGWHDNWGNINSLPQLVMLDIESSDGKRYQSTIRLLTSNNV